jgi:hypothetical protein
MVRRDAGHSGHRSYFELEAYVSIPRSLSRFLKDNFSPPTGSRLGHLPALARLRRSFCFIPNLNEIKSGIAERRVHWRAFATGISRPAHLKFGGGI